MVTNLLSMVNPLKSVDIIFFIVCLAIVAIGIGFYFLIPVLNKKQYQEQRENLKKREEAFNSNKKITNSAEAAVENSEKTAPDKGKL